MADKLGTASQAFDSLNPLVVTRDPGVVPAVTH